MLPMLSQPLARTPSALLLLVPSQAELSDAPELLLAAVREGEKSAVQPSAPHQNLTPSPGGSWAGLL